MRSRDHEHNPFLFNYLKEESPASNSIPPGVRLEPPKLFDVWPKVWLLAQLRIHNLTELFDHPNPSCSRDSLEVLLKLVGLENAIVTQRSRLFACERPTIPP